MTLLHLPLFLRTVRKEGEIYALKIASLAIAFSCALVVIVFCWNEFGYDRFNVNPTSVFRVLKKNERFDFEGNRFTDRIPQAIFHGIDLPGVAIARCKVLERQVVAAGGKQFDEIVIHATDANISSVFSFDWLAGDPLDFTDAANKAMLSESKATLLFGSVDCIGQKFSVVLNKDSVPLTVAAVFRNFPLNTHESFDFFMPYDSIALKKLSTDPNDFGLYGRVGAESTYEKATHFINASIARRDTTIKYQLQSLTEIYFGRRVIGESAGHGDRYSILILICIASLITLLAITNYINLTTLTLPNRSGEIAIRKVAGAQQRSVLAKLAIESAFLVVIAFFFAAILLLATRNWVSSLLPMDVFDFFRNHYHVIVMAVPVLVLLTIIGPLVIALRFVRAAPSRLLSSDRITFPRFKRIVSVLQLGISLSLIVAGIIVRNQINYSLVKEPGRNKDQIVYLPYPPGLTDYKRQKLAEEWRTGNPNIEGLSAVSNIPNQVVSKKLGSPFYSLITDYQFPGFFRYPVVSGRWFGASDTIASVINEKGASLSIAQDKPVIGIISDLGKIYNQSEKPVSIDIGDYKKLNFLCVRIIEVDVRQTVAYLERKFELPHGAVKFIDRKFEQWLIYEDRLGALCGMLAVVSLAMAGFAIYGLSLSTGNDKIRQAAIHKMLGASSAQVVVLLTRVFMVPVIVATLSFGLVTYIGLSEWLRTFIYKTHFGFGQPLIAISFCALIIVLTSIRQARKLNGANLVKWLK